MDGLFNTTYLFVGGYVELARYRFLYFTIVFASYIFIICCNSTIIGLICIHKNLHEPMYYFIAALLANSVLFSTVIYPKLLIDFLSDRQIISLQACLWQFYLYYSLAGSEFLLLAVMCYDRYVSICKPLQYPTVMTKRTIVVLIALAWLLPACQMVGTIILNVRMKLCHFTVKGILCNNSVFKLHCAQSVLVMWYGVIVALTTALSPLFFILFTYGRILIITHQSSREVRRKAAQTCLPHLLVLISFSILSAYDIAIVRLESDLPKAARLIMTLQAIIYHPLCNPIIYGLKMKTISKHLKNLFCHSKLF